jgi:glutathione peroxidase
MGIAKSIRHFLLLPAVMANTLSPVQDEAPITEKSVLDFTMIDIDGHAVHLSTYKGLVILIVNVASKCGNTPQYKALEALYEKYRSAGFTILAFPANNFLGQEPGSDEEIKRFCTATYGVTFELFSKISVRGKDMHPLYRFLTSKETDPLFAGPIQWNFQKFLVGKDGEVVGRFAPGTDPLSPEVTAAIDHALNEQ